MKKLTASTSKTWNKDRERMIKVCEKDPCATVETLKRFTKYSDGTKAALIANLHR